MRARVGLRVEGRVVTERSPVRGYAVEERLDVGRANDVDAARVERGCKG